MTGTIPTFGKRLLDWYDAHHRKLPWRASPGSPAAPDPYHVLVSEAMLQQTRVATVIPYFERFLELFPTIQSLARADEQAVLRAWQGLGYYSRARNLKKSAMRIVDSFGGQVPSTVGQLLELPGVGRYTAGAVASIAFGRRSPILDGNVARVLCRIDAVKNDPTETATRDLLWARAEQVLPKDRPGDFNSALMELGALVCTPRSPQCLICPVRRQCDAAAAGLQEQIPPPKKRKTNPLLRRWVFVIRRGNRYLMEQRPPTGRWAGMWQFVTVDAGPHPPTEKTFFDRFAFTTASFQHTGTVRHALTHRLYEFDIYLCETTDPHADKAGEWKTPGEIDRLPLPKPHVTIRRRL